METKIKKLLLIISIIFITCSMWSQENYYIQDTEDGAVFVQTLRWDPNPDVYKYDFTIEKEGRRGKYELVDHQETTESFVNVTLSAGHYRYKLILYNYLGLPELETEWYPLDVIKAYQPKISSVSPSTIYLEEEQDGIFSIDGYELREDTTYVLKNGSTELVPLKVERDSRHRKVKLYFNPDDLDSGNWSVVATNVGGLKFDYNPVKIQFKKAQDFDIAGGYSFIWIPGDATFKDYFQTQISAIGLSMRATYIFLKTKKLYYGVSLNISNCYYANSLPKYDLSTFFTIASIDFNLQIPFMDKKVFWDLRIGGGLSAFYDMHFTFPHDLISPPLNLIAPNASLGTAVIFYPTKRLFLSLGVETSVTFNSVFDSEVDKRMYMFSIIPYIEVGYQF